MNKLAIVAVLAAVMPLCSCGESDTRYTLYRSSVTVPMRVHVASFDAVEGAEYNNENCKLAASLFQNQPGTKVKFWCEKGMYRR